MSDARLPSDPAELLRYVAERLDAISDYGEPQGTEYDLASHCRAVAEVAGRPKPEHHDDCPDHGRDEGPWMCQCTRERLAAMRATVERVAELAASFDRVGLEIPSHRELFSEVARDIRAALAPAPEAAQVEADAGGKGGNHEGR